MKAIKTAVIAAAVTYLVIVTGGAVLTQLGMAGTGTLGATLTAAGFAASSAIVTGVGTLIASGIGMLTSRGLNATGQNFGTKIAGSSCCACCTFESSQPCIRRGRTDLCIDTNSINGRV